MALKPVIGGFVDIPAGGGGNPFDQNLNTTDTPSFQGLNINTNLFIDDNNYYYPISGTSLATSESILNYGNGNTLADSLGNLYYGGFNQKISDGINGLFYVGGSYLINGTQLRDSSDNKISDAINLYYPGGTTILCNGSELFSSNGELIADGSFIYATDGSTVIANSSGLIGFGGNLTGLTASQFGGITPVDNGTYTVGLGVTNNGTLTFTNGFVTAIQEAS